MQTDARTKRHPWLAAFLSLLLPGLGQLYCGAFVRGLSFLVLSSGTGLLGILALVPNLQLSGTVVALIEGLALLVYVAGMIDAFRLARRMREDYALKDYNRWYAYALLYVAVSAGHLFSALYARDHLMRPFKAGSASMYPTIWEGDQMMAATNAYATKDPAPGDVVTFHNPENRSQIFIKRVVAVSGDSIEIRGGDIYVNGTKLGREPMPAPTGSNGGGTYYYESNRGARYRIFLSGRDPRLRNLSATIVPKHHCFVLGDNRDESLDSRSFGPIPVVGVGGKVGFVYAPLDRMGAVQ